MAHAHAFIRACQMHCILSNTCAQVVDAMEAEIERADCREMVRDITHAVLPTRQTVMGRGVSAAVQPGGTRPAVASQHEMYPAKRYERNGHTEERCSSSEDLQHGENSTDAHVPSHYDSSEGGVAWLDETAEAHRLAMQAAIAADRFDIVDDLLRGIDASHRCDPNGILRSGKTYLSLAAAGGLAKVTSTLLANGADPNRMDANGDHPLHLAASRDRLAVARLLLDAGAVSSVIDGNGETPILVATSDAMRRLLHCACELESPAHGHGADALHHHDDENSDDVDAEEADAQSVLTAAEGNFIAPSQKGHQGDCRRAAHTVAASHTASNDIFATTVGPPAPPNHTLGDAAVLPQSLPRPLLVAELQSLLCSPDTDVKRLLVIPRGLAHEVQLDVLRVGKSNTYQCFLRLGAQSDRRICIFEASRSRKGKLKNSEYQVKLPQSDPRLYHAATTPEALDAALYCGKVRSYNLSGANFVAYDDGVKLEADGSCAAGQRPRRQMVAMTFSKSSSRRVPMTMRMLVPSMEIVDAPNSASHSTAAAQPSAAAELLDSLQALPAEDIASPPLGTRLLKLVPPRWNADEQMFQLFCEGRACCMSNKNVQLADTLVPDRAVLQVGKLSANMFNVDLHGCISPFQAFCSALAVFDQSSVRRRF